MSVRKTDEKPIIFASLISPSKISLFEKLYQAFDTVFHHLMKHLGVGQKYSAARRIFNSLSSGDETLRLMLDFTIINIKALHGQRQPSHRYTRTCLEFTHRNRNERHLQDSSTSQPLYMN